MFLSGQFKTAKICKQPISPSTDEQMAKIQYLYIVEYYSDIRKVKLKSLVRKRVDNETITLRDKSVYKLKYCMSCLLRNPKHK